MNPQVLHPEPEPVWNLEVRLDNGDRTSHSWLVLLMDSSAVGQVEISAKDQLDPLYSFLQQLGVMLTSGDGNAPESDVSGGVQIVISVELSRVPATLICQPKERQCLSAEHQ